MGNTEITTMVRISVIEVRLCWDPQHTKCKSLELGVKSQDQESFRQSGSEALCLLLAQRTDRNKRLFFSYLMNRHSKMKTDCEQNLSKSDNLSIKMKVSYLSLSQLKSSFKIMNRED